MLDKITVRDLFQGLLALAVVGAAIWEVYSRGYVDETLAKLLFVVIGYYFGASVNSAIVALFGKGSK